MSTPHKSGHSKPHATTTSPKPAVAPPGASTLAKQVLRQRRQALQLAKLCAHSRSAAKLPTSAAGMPRYARAVLPLARRHAAALKKPTSTQLRQRLALVSSMYNGLIPFLEQIAQPGASRTEVKALTGPTTRMVQALQGVARGAGVPHCALPV